MKSSLTLIIVCLFSVELAGAEPRFYYLGLSGNESLVVDASRTATIQYPIKAAGAPTSKTYQQTWVMFIGSEGKITRQAIWVFDCAGRAGELAAFFSETSAGTSYDLTAHAQGIGVERYLRRIRPMTPFDNAQNVVCLTVSDEDR